jgi:hypothetical protein
MQDFATLMGQHQKDIEHTEQGCIKLGSGRASAGIYGSGAL